MGAYVLRKVLALPPMVEVSGSQPCIDPRRRRSDAGGIARSHVELGQVAILKNTANTPRTVAESPEISCPLGVLNAPQPRHSKYLSPSSFPFAGACALQIVQSFAQLPGKT